MLSILQEIHTAEQLKAIALGWSSAHLSCLADLRRLAVRVDPQLTSKYEMAIGELETPLKNGPSREQLSESTATLRRILSDYRVGAEDFLANLRSQLDETVKALNEVLRAMTAERSQQDQLIRQSLQDLKDSVEIPDPETMRASVRSLTTVLAGCIEQMKQQHALAVAQLTDELSVLHKRLDSIKIERDSVSVRFVVEDAIDEGSPFSLVLVQLANLSGLRSAKGSEVAAAAIQSTLDVLKETAGSTAAVGCWNRSTLAVLLPLAEDALKYCRSIVTALARPIEVRADGCVHSMRLQIRTASMQRPALEPAEKSRLRLSALLKTLAPEE